jgi:hypothetical protein
MYIAPTQSRSGDRAQGDGGGERPVRLHQQRVHFRDAHHQEAGRGGGRARHRRQGARLARIGAFGLTLKGALGLTQLKG